jgi:hypothetical protein
MPTMYATASGAHMPKHKRDRTAGWWAKSLDDVDAEVARLATLCGARVLDPQVIERVLQNDATVCGIKNPVAFTKLRTALTLHYHLRDQAVGAIGETQTQVLVAGIVARLRQRFGDRLGEPPPS